MEFEFFKSHWYVGATLMHERVWQSAVKTVNIFNPETDLRCPSSYVPEQKKNGDQANRSDKALSLRTE